MCTRESGIRSLLEYVLHLAEQRSFRGQVVLEGGSADVLAVQLCGNLNNGSAQQNHDKQRFCSKNGQQTRTVDQQTDIVVY